MTTKAPGRAHRKGLTLLQIADMFRDEDHAREWVEKFRWPDGPYCPECGSFNVQSGIKHKTMTHRCRDCPEKTFFTLRKGSVMEGSKLPFRIWAVGIYLFTTNIKGISSMRLHRELGIGQKAAWFMLHRLREAFAQTGSDDKFAGPVEVDETYMGGKRSNMPLKKRKHLTGRGPVGKTAVVGAKDRATKRVKAMVVSDTTKETLQGFVADVASPDAQVYTDEHKSYQGMPFPHEAVKHSVGEYVRDMAHTNGMESFWALLKRGHEGTYHSISPKHLGRYVAEFQGRHNDRDEDTANQMGSIVERFAGKRLRYADLITNNGLPSGSRSTARN